MISQIWDPTVGYNRSAPFDRRKGFENEIISVSEASDDVSLGQGSKVVMRADDHEVKFELVKHQVANFVEKLQIRDCIGYSELVVV